MNLIAILNGLHLLLCAAICLRVLLFRRPGYTYRPRASFIAYLIVVAAGWSVLIDILGVTSHSLSDVFLTAVLAAVVFACRGNVMRMFYVGDDEHPICRIIGGLPHA